jgi:DNA-binding GntR family transcriptional regulator
LSVLTEGRITRQPTLADQVYDLVCEGIITGELRSGERLVLEQMAVRFGVSLTPVREAIIRLTHEGLVADNRDGKPAVVPLTKQYVDEIFLVRGALEGLAAELAATRLSQRALDELRGLLESGTAAVNVADVRTYGDAGHELHTRIIEAANNSTLARELKSIHTHFMYIRNYSQRQFGEHHIPAQEEHWKIYAALANRDAAAAKHIMEQHIRQSGIRIAELIEREERNHQGREDRAGVRR